jgi:DNA invertase Pin-like site-specific DNA recombinase
MPDALCAADVHGCRKEADMNTEKTVILYERLSKDDELQGPSNSILNQRSMLEEYAERNNLKPYIHIQDDGFSGVSFARPGWQELMSMVEADKVSAIIVKTLDRMGRNYLQTGMYREVLQERGVRLIAVSDGIDTSLGEDDFTPFREIMSEWYARDTSKKIKAAFKTKGQSGKPLTGKPPYGFIKDPNDKNRWLVDPEAAAVVRRIYDLIADGKGAEEICRMFHREKIERPSYYSAKRGLINSDKALEADDPYVWRTTVIRGIVARQEYLGHTVNFRRSKPSYKSKKLVVNPQEDWLIFENTHEPIVDKKTWDLAQRVRQTVKRTDTTGEANPLTGLLFCSDCGGKLYNHRSKIDHYTCPGYTLGRQRFQENHCTAHYVSTELVREVILYVIKNTIGYAREREAEFVEKVRDMYSLRQGETAKTYTRQIAKNERRIAELDKLFTNMYEDKVSGAISAERFAQMSGGYEREQAGLKAQNETLQSELAAFKTDSMRAENFLALVRRYTRVEALTNAMIYEFVDKIIIHECVWSEQDETNRRKGTRTQKIEVFLKYIGDFNAPDMRSPEEIEAERVAEEALEEKRARGREATRRYIEKKRAAAQ